MEGQEASVVTDYILKVKIDDELITCAIYFSL